MMTIRVKSCNFRQQVNLDIHLQTAKNPDEMALDEPSHWDFYCLLSYFNFFQ